MTFSTDRDLLLFEPLVFHDVPIAAQQRLRVDDGVLTGTTLTSATADFAAAQVDAGSVVLIAGVAHEVIQRIDPNTLEVSLPRQSLGSPAIAGVDGADLAAIARTFAPQ